MIKLATVRHSDEPDGVVFCEFSNLMSTINIENLFISLLGTFTAMIFEEYFLLKVR